MVRDALVLTLWKDQWEWTLLPISGAQGCYVTLTMLTLRHSHNECHGNSVASSLDFPFHDEQNITREELSPGILVPLAEPIAQNIHITGGFC